MISLAPRGGLHYRHQNGKCLLCRNLNRAWTWCLELTRSDVRPCAKRHYTWQVNENLLKCLMSLRHIRHVGQSFKQGVPFLHTFFRFLRVIPETKKLHPLHLNNTSVSLLIQFIQRIQHVFCIFLRGFRTTWQAKLQVSIPELGKFNKALLHLSSRLQENMPNQGQVPNPEQGQLVCWDRCFPQVAPQSRQAFWQDGMQCLAPSF